MLNKTMGYSGFRPYAEHPYSTLKQGKELQLKNQVWSSTRQQNHSSKPFSNFNNSHTIYENSYLQNTLPENYHPEHVPKGGHRTLHCSQSGCLKTSEKEEKKKNGRKQEDERKSKVLQSGTQYWKTNYQKMNERMNSETKETEGKEQFWKGNSTGKSLHRLAEEGKQNSYKNKPYINNSKLEVSDYKFNYGEKIGASPLNLMDRVSLRQPIRENPLKKGTNQLWSQIPRYQGFKPSELKFKDYEKRIEERNQIQKGNLKLQVSQNFLVNIPGYGGYKPHFQNQALKLRTNCISDK